MEDNWCTLQHGAKFRGQDDVISTVTVGLSIMDTIRTVGRLARTLQRFVRASDDHVDFHLAALWKYSLGSVMAVMSCDLSCSFRSCRMLVNSVEAATGCSFCSCSRLSESVLSVEGDSLSELM